MSTTLLRIVADLQLSLAAAVSVGQTTATLSSSDDSDAVALPSGKYGFTVDGDTSAKEYIVCDLVGTALTNIQHISRQGAATSGFANYHRFGATVTITDWAILSRMLNNLTGATGFDSAQALSYDGAVAGLTGNQIPTVNYVLSVVNGGAVTFDQQVASNQTAGENLTAQNLVYFKSSDQKWWKVDTDTVTTTNDVPFGIALATVSADASLSIAISGPVTMTGLTAGSKYYASATAGAITVTAGTPAVFIGYALSTTSLLLQPAPRVGQLAYVQKEPTVQTFDATGTYTKPAGLKYAIVEVQAAGGGGGGAAFSGSNGSAGGGASGPYARKKINASAIAATETVTVGAGGTGGIGAGANGGQGGTTSFGALVSVTGGPGALTVTGTTGVNAIGAVTTAGDINVPGRTAPIAPTSTLAGNGADSFMGIGGLGGANTDGVAGTGYGSGGGGANDLTGGATERNGAAGRPGLVVVTEYYI